MPPVFCASIPRLLLFYVAALAFLFTSCSKKTEEIPPEPEPEQAADIWEGEKSTLLVLAGRDFPQESGIADFVLREYGLAEENGRARLLYWPRDFGEGDDSLRRVSNAAREEGAEIVASIGAPEGTLGELNRIRSEFPEIKIVSIFPSDDALAVEAVSDMVIDMDISAAEGIDAATSSEEETALDMTAREAAALLLGAIFSMESERAAEAASAAWPKSAALKTGMSLAEDVAMHSDESFLELRWKYVQAVDPDTGLRSRKHVLIQKAANAQR